MSFNRVRPINNVEERRMQQELAQQVSTSLITSSSSHQQQQHHSHQHHSQQQQEYYNNNNSQHQQYGYQNSDEQQQYNNNTNTNIQYKPSSPIRYQHVNIQPPPPNSNIININDIRNSQILAANNNNNRISPPRQPQVHQHHQHHHQQYSTSSSYYQQVAPPQTSQQPQQYQQSQIQYQSPQHQQQYLNEPSHSFHSNNSNNNSNTNSSNNGGGLTSSYTNSKSHSSMISSSNSTNITNNNSNITNSTINTSNNTNITNNSNITNLSNISYEPSKEIITDDGDEVGIKVVVRVRPFNEREIKLKSTKSVSTLKQNHEITLKRKFKDDKKFYFDDIFDEYSTQYDVYASTGKRVLDRFVLGFNCCIFAYGQTGSGKTWTMQGIKGNESKEGIMSRFVRELFTYIERERDRTEITLKASYFEIYNEQVYDLLNPNTINTHPILAFGSNINSNINSNNSNNNSNNNNSNNLNNNSNNSNNNNSNNNLNINNSNNTFYEIREDKIKGIHINNLIEKPILKVTELNDLLIEGSSRRTVGETKMNSESSRSHSILQIYMEQQDKTDIEDGYSLTCNKISLIDLAGSERQSATSKNRQKEGSKINLSLSNLGNVINAIVKKSNFIPYRNSKLTRLLKDSIGGNSFTLIVVCLSPSDLNIEESLSCLYFADRAKHIKNKIKIIRGDPNLDKINLLLQNEKILKQRILELENQLFYYLNNNILLNSNTLNSNILNSTLYNGHLNNNTTINGNINNKNEISTMTELYGYEIDEAFDYYRTINAIEVPPLSQSKEIQTDYLNNISNNNFNNNISNNNELLTTFNNKHYQHNNNLNNNNIIKIQDEEIDLDEIMSHQQQQQQQQQPQELIFDEMKEEEMIEQERREQELIDQQRLEQEIIDQLDMIDDQPGLNQYESNVGPFNNEYIHQHSHEHHPDHYQNVKYNNNNNNINNINNISKQNYQDEYDDQQQQDDLIDQEYYNQQQEYKNHKNNQFNQTKVNRGEYSNYNNNNNNNTKGNNQMQGSQTASEYYRDEKEKCIIL